MKHTTVGWQWVDTRGKSAQMYHMYNMEKHLQVLAKPKAVVHLHKPDPTWVRRTKNRLAEEVRIAKMPPGTRFNKEMATSNVYEEQREVRRRVAKAASGTN